MSLLSTSSLTIFKFLIIALLAAHLKPPYRHLDCHPKTADPQLSILKRKFSGGVRLKIKNDPPSKMTDQVLHTKYESMSLATYEMWLKDIEGGHYKVIKADKNDESDGDDGDDGAEAEHNEQEDEARDTPEDTPVDDLGAAV